MNEIDQEHPDFKYKRPMRHMYRDLYAGWHQFKSQAANYLLRRQKEPLDIYSERLERVFYQNYIGSILDWYSSTLFRRELSFQLKGGVGSGRAFLADFIDDADLRGTKLSSFLKTCFTDALIAGTSHVLIDSPVNETSAQTRAEEDQAGI